MFFFCANRLFSTSLEEVVCLFMRRLLTFLFLFASVTTHAQFLGIGRRAKAGDTPPRVMLIELLTRQNQREHLQKYRPDLLPQFEHDVQEVSVRTRRDWASYFHFCPVYFFIDTNADKIRRGEFEGVLLDSSLNPIQDPILKPGDRDFYIGYFGSPIHQPDSMRKTTHGQTLGQYGEHDGDDPTSLFRERLLVNDPDFRLLPDTKPRTNYIRALRPSWMTVPQYRIYHRSIYYNASKWYIDYMPVAHSYDATLKRFFRVTKSSEYPTATAAMR
jgi:hypothetical protein